MKKRKNSRKLIICLLLVQLIFLPAESPVSAAFQCTLEIPVPVIRVGAE